ncbi:MAG: YIP1 family protein [Candidatus Krumholzibacteria bacterium]|nr:YIP1 family protein [Candidatus Krumholzibacteria bacterium]
MSFLDRIGWIFVSPSKVFADIREGRVSWWQPYIVVAAMYTVLGVIGLPIQRAVAALNAGNLSPEDLDRQLEIMAKFGLVQVLGTPVVLLAIGALVAGLTYIVVTLLSPQASFKKYFTITMFASIVAGVGQVLSTIVVRGRGVDAIRSQNDAMAFANLRFLAPPDSKVLEGALSTIEPFSLWSLALVGMGVAHVFGMTRGRAVAVVVPWWLIYVATSILGAVVAGIS